jgi:DNA processing protein
MIYPPENKPLAEEIIQSGAIISQFPLDILSLPGNFPCRNRVIAGLSLGTVVVEGTSDSGSLITAGYSRECNRPVFAVPGPITSPLSEGPSQLIKDGARLVTSGGDILKELRIMNYESSIKKNKIDQEKIKFNNQTEEKIWQVLVGGIKHLDEIVRESQLPVGEVCSTLTKLELQGTVKNLGNGEYCL